MLMVMGSLGNIATLVIGINLILVGAVAVISGFVALVKQDAPVKKLTAVSYLVAGAVAVYVGIGLARSSFL